ncbi:hypothetical protein I204_02651 [Kwoniella mangroviensis CBS 8886]|nr:hypothetical protein I204_02651 [Kwoniella mangroviensis CBS 8886]
MRRRSNSAEIKAISEGPRVKIKVASEVEQVRAVIFHEVKILADLSYVTRKNHLKGFNKRCKAIRDKYEGMKINEVKNVWDECKSINDEMDGLVRVDTERWGLKDVLFE